MMGKFIQFWQKDIINKLIVLVVLLIIIGLGTQVYILVGTPAGKTLLNSLNPTPTLSVDQIFRSGEATITAEALLSQTAIIPTITTMPFTPLVQTPAPSGSPTASKPVPSPTRFLLTATSTPTPLKSLTASPTRTPFSTSGSCLPKKEPQNARVLEIIDGNTVRALIGDLVYVVRYIGVAVPQDPNFAQLSSYQNGQMVYSKLVKLYAGDTDKDGNNRLLRYVVVGDSTLVNQELILRGLGTAETSTYDCSAVFAAAEQEAKANRVGMWQVK